MHYGYLTALLRLQTCLQRFEGEEFLLGKLPIHHEVITLNL
jgi:hypothetical protein